MPRKAINRDLHSPIIVTTPAFSDTEDLPVTLRGLDILVPGTIKVRTINGGEATYTFTAFVAAGGNLSTFPYRLELQITRIYDSGSSLTAADVVSLR